LQISKCGVKSSICPGRIGKLFVRPYRTLWIWLFSALAGALILIGAFRLDGAVHRWQYEHRWKNIQVLSRNVTRATDWPSHALVGVGLAALAWRRRNKRWMRIFLTMVAALVLAGTSAYALKLTTGRVRPYVKLEKTWSGPTTMQNFHSFPSGHTAASFGFFMVLFFVNWRIALLCLPVPIFVGFTRIFLGAHYFSDVVGAALLGVLSAAILAEWLLRWPDKTTTDDAELSSDR
jgi:membrane-associated phospholipid phosphatase